MEKIIFKPKFSLWGWLLPLLVLGFVWFCIWLKYPMIFVRFDLLKIHGLGLVLLTLLFVFEVVILFTIEYEFGDEALYLKGGHLLLKYPILK